MKRVPAADVEEVKDEWDHAGAGEERNMAKSKKKSADPDNKRRESGEPGGGQGRRDEVGGSGVYSRSAENIPDDAVIRTPQQWGQGDRGAEGYEDSGGSELVWREGQLLGGLTSDASGRPTIDTHGGDRPDQYDTGQSGEEHSEETSENHPETGQRK